jgi:hypothetical protein
MLMSFFSRTMRDGVNRRGLYIPRNEINCESARDAAGASHRARRSHRYSFDLYIDVWLRQQARGLPNRPSSERQTKLILDALPAILRAAAFSSSAAGTSPNHTRDPRGDRGPAEPQQRAAAAAASPGVCPLLISELVAMQYPQNSTLAVEFARHRTRAARMLPLRCKLSFCSNHANRVSGGWKNSALKFCTHRHRKQRASRRRGAWRVPPRIAPYPDTPSVR